MKTTGWFQLAVLVFTISALGADKAALQQEHAAQRAFMRQKLLYSQGIMEGLTLEKFELISKNAIKLRNMTQTNFWARNKQPEYLAHTTNYYKEVDGLYMAAVDKNLEAATEAYMKVARSCVECHRLVRTAQHKVTIPRK